jgi:hypothetical protein
VEQRLGECRGGQPGGEGALKAQENLGCKEDQEDEPEQQEQGECGEPAGDLAAGDDGGGVHAVGVVLGLAHEAGDEFGGAAEGGVAFLGDLDGGGDAFFGVGQGDIDEAGGGSDGGAVEDRLEEAVGHVAHGSPGGDDQGNGEGRGHLDAGAQHEDGDEPEDGGEGEEFEGSAAERQHAGTAGDDAEGLEETRGKPTICPGGSARGAALGGCGG